MFWQVTNLSRSLMPQTTLTSCMSVPWSWSVAAMPTCVTRRQRSWKVSMWPTLHGGTAPLRNPCGCLKSVLLSSAVNIYLFPCICQLASNLKCRKNVGLSLFNRKDWSQGLNPPTPPSTPAPLAHTPKKKLFFFFLEKCKQSNNCPHHHKKRNKKGRRKTRILHV